MNRERVLNGVARFLRSSAVGCISLLTVNFGAGMTGISLGLGWLSCGAALLLGAPGVVALLVLNALFSMA